MLTRFSLYLQSNQAPSEDETREIKALRARPLKEISIIDVDIKKIQHMLNSLERKRALIQASIEDFNIVLAPVRRLSADVLGVIFSYCLATHRNPILSASEAPILLTHICREWRSVALSNPQLWSRLYIPTLPRTPHYMSNSHSNLETFEERRLNAHTQEVKRWLKHSAACTLAITLVPANEEVSQPLLDAIIGSSRRWQQLELGFLSSDSESNLLSSLLSLSPDDLCTLRELRIHSLCPNLHTNDRSGLFTAQGLRSISIAKMSLTNAFDAGIPPNWKNLNHLSIHSSILPALAHRMLSHCCNLVACHFEITEWGGIFNGFVTIPDASITLSPCILSHLTFLSLQGDLACCNQLFRSIEASSLKILDYHGIFASLSAEFGLLNLLQSINSLETLRVDHHYLAGNNVLEYYTLIPSVTHLVLGQPSKQDSTSEYQGYPTPNPSDGAQTSIWSIPVPISYDFTTLLKLRHQYSTDSSPTLLFPSLEIFEAYNILGVTDVMLLEFIKSRIDATKSNHDVSKLKKVLVEFSRTRQTDIIPEALAYAQAAGIKLELDLKYYTTRKESTGKAAWTPSFGLLPGDVSWQYPLYDYSC